MVKISDVAREAGVSVATVSRALNGLATVNPEYAQRVHIAAEKLGYRGNAIARGLRRRKTDMLALIISDVANPFYTAIARGVEDVAENSGYSVILCNADEDAAKESRYLRAVEIGQVAGVILSPHSGTTDVSRLRAADVPLVVVDRPLAEPVDSVMVQSVDGARAATRHLLDEGWRRPACVTGPADAATALDRLHGYRLALADSGLGIAERFVHGQFSQADGAAGASALIDGAEPPDSFFAANTQLALGVIAELRARGLRIGQDVGLIMFDDAPWAPFIDPPISVVAQPAYEIGVHAARLLLSRVTGAEAGPARDLVLSTELVVRGSSRRVPT
ncbi:LacI family DNA-binding transcriptional regulator [Pseudolysinimonas yzui]|uniref:LacI family transcriptional regulator n=1 Tax=Pseudolysinimonas yzui TaxID=2708254 RepID=A0A8J3GSP0_9MICO|nr:LacI family DNA-binding transcriptional regulator [Pseudolysinimonas yzui]GHF22957.1 LacI family transcriptional regulator [Pseudolysinimonas yzui]